MLLHRNIPAYAGKTMIPHAAKSLGQEHPRVCGENSADFGGCRGRSGTSPRMRGKPGHHRSLGPPPRNIPAYAGKTCAAAIFRHSSAEHPRVCGENASQPGNFDSMAGTSPRMRGKPACTQLPTSCTRNIPAYAGKTILLSSRNKTLPEHPRVCGENLWNIYYGPTKFGTSPRMRGKRVYTLSVRYADRNIPAYAGKTFTI